MRNRATLCRLQPVLVDAVIQDGHVVVIFSTTTLEKVNHLVHEVQKCIRCATDGARIENTHIEIRAGHF